MLRNKMYVRPICETRPVFRRVMKAPAVVQSEKKLTYTQQVTEALEELLKLVEEDNKKEEQELKKESTCCIIF